jgi:hypothetical protein
MFSKTILNKLMSVFEIIGEILNPGGVGEVRFDGKGKHIEEKFIIIRFVISLLIIGLYQYVFVITTEFNVDLAYVIRVNSALFFYLVIAFFVTLYPDRDNLGWVPFIINNPFRISDNINRWMVFFKIILLPGRYVSRGIVCYIQYLFQKR